jgi:methyltransferase (TIGR00027 family)
MTDPNQTRLRGGKPSTTAQGAAEGRAAHQLLDRPLIFEDRLAIRILGREGEAKLRAGLADHRAPFMRALRSQFVGRSRYAEDRVAAAISRGTRQYVVLGAGLDTYACRHADEKVRIFEVDHPATQAWKRDRLAEVGLDPPASLAFAPVDFESEGLGDALSKAGFDHAAPAFVAFLGVSYYLQADAFYESLRWAACLAAGSEIVFDFMPAPSQQSAQGRAVFEQVAARVASEGEPLRSTFEPAQLSERVLSLGFREAEVVTAGEVNAAYFEALGSDLRMRGYLMRACV